MKVLFLTNLPAPYRVEFFDELGKLVDLTVLYEVEKAKDRDRAWKTISSDTYQTVFLKSWFQKTDSAFCPDVISWLDQFQNDIIIIGGYSTPTGMLAVQYLNRKKIPFILNIDGGMKKEDKWYIRKVKEYFIGKASWWLSTGKTCDEYLLAYGANIECIYHYSFTSLRRNDILKEAISDCEKKRIREELKIKETKVVLAVGQFISRKGFDILLRAADGIGVDCGIYIIGGKVTQEYQQLVDDLELKNIHFCKFMKKEQLKKYYLASDLFVLPTREDIWGLVINEAMSCGLPVITTDHCVAGLELIENERNGYIVPVDNVCELRRAIECVLKNDNKRSKMAGNSLKTIEKYTIENMAMEHFAILKEIVDEKD